MAPDDILKALRAGGAVPDDAVAQWLLEALRAECIGVELDGTGIALDGPDDAIARWLSVVRDHKVMLLAALREPVPAKTLSQLCPSCGNKTSPSSDYCLCCGFMESSPDDIASFRWSLHFAVRETLEVTCSPMATHGEVLASYPGAVAAEPMPVGHIENGREEQ